MVSETKLDSSFSTCNFLLKNMHLHFDMTDSEGVDILIVTMRNISFELLDMSEDFQASLIEILLSNLIWNMFPIMEKLDKPGNWFSLANCVKNTSEKAEFLVK